MPIERSELVLNSTLIHNGVKSSSGDPIPEELSDAMVQGMYNRNEARRKNDPSTGTIIRSEPADPNEPTPEPAVPEPNAARLGPDVAIDPAGLEGMEVDELNVLAAEKGWGGEPFTEAAAAVNYLSANYSR